MSDWWCAMVAGSQRFSRTNPCPICGGCQSDPQGKGVRCYGFISGDGRYAHCSREEHAGPLVEHRDGTFVHRLTGECHCGMQHGPGGPSSTESNGHKKSPKGDKPAPKVIRTTRYRSVDPETGELLGIHVREDREDGTKRVWWEPKGLNGRRLEDLPLFGSEALKEHPDKTIVLVEGEKCQEAL